MTEISSITGKALESLSLELSKSRPLKLVFSCRVRLAANNRLENANVRRLSPSGLRPRRVSLLNGSRPSSPDANENLTLDTKTSGRKSIRWALSSGRGPSSQSRTSVRRRCRSDEARTTRWTRPRRASLPQLCSSRPSDTSSSLGTSPPTKNADKSVSRARAEC